MKLSTLLAIIFFLLAFVIFFTFTGDTGCMGFNHPCEGRPANIHWSLMSVLAGTTFLLASYTDMWGV